MSEQHQCDDRQVYNPAGSWGNKYKRCSRKGVVERDGKWWCRQHDPEAVKARAAESFRRYRAEMDDLRLAGLALQALHGIPAKALRAGVVADMRAALKAALEDLEDVPGREPPKSLAAVRAVLAKLEDKPDA